MFIARGRITPLKRKTARPRVRMTTGRCAVHVTTRRDGCAYRPVALEAKSKTPDVPLGNTTRIEVSLAPAGTMAEHTRPIGEP
ncbi:hypothetical protein [Piscicoccus intestinalis]|uniref:hypothetical protein n=1 Tax=Piscicoccus intestinalis TaxID=746033 RepID=UPI0012EDF3B4|nr:hypothetical protein [Piscicoccus intestinalis]